MSKRYDVIVIGAGHNGLAAAALLAKRGREVLVVERREIVGGLAAGEEFSPGYRSPGVLHHTSGVRRWVVEELDLEKHGLAFRSEPTAVFVPQMEGDGLLLWRDPGRAQEELTRHSAHDAERYRQYRTFLTRLAPVVRRFIDRHPPNVVDPGISDLLDLAASAWSLRMLGKKRMMEVLRIAPMCVADWLGEWFETDLLRAALAAPAIAGTFNGPRSPGSNANLLLAEVQTGPPVRGGPQALVAALERAVRANGAEIRTGAPVQQIDYRNGIVSGVRLAGGEAVEAGAVAASCDPRHLFFDLVPPGYLSRRCEQGIAALRTRGTTAKVNLALSFYPDLSCRPGLQPEAIRTGEGIDELERAFDAVKYRRFSDRPILDVFVPTVHAPELAPEGHHVFSVLVHFAPFDLEGGWSGDQKDRLFDRVVQTLADYAPGIREAIIGSEVLSPADLESRHGVTGGHVHHGEHSLDQLLVRPSAECAGYRTPHQGLYLCGSGSHPGGGITCAPGALAARTILRG